MNRWAVDGEQPITVLQAFDAMRAFPETYWERGQKEADDTAVLLGSLNRDEAGDGTPLDTAQWRDWLDAAARVGVSRQ